MNISDEIYTYMHICICNIYIYEIKHLSIRKRTEQRQAESRNCVSKTIELKINSKVPYLFNFFFFYRKSASPIKKTKHKLQHHNEQHRNQQSQKWRKMKRVYFC